MITRAPPVRSRRFFGYAALPKMEISSHRDGTPGRGMLQRVIEQISDGLLYLLVIEFEDGQLFGEHGFEPHVIALKRLVPTRSQFGQAIAQIIVTQVQDELAAFQSRIVQEHGNKTNQPFTAIL